MGDHLSRAMSVVRRDVEAMGAPMPAVEDSDWQTWPGADSAYLRNPDGTGMGVWVDTAASEAEQVTMLADQVQDWVVELATGRMTSWPSCPDHPDNHPMEAAVRAGAAMWVCPRSRRPVREIGRLGTAEW